MIARVCVCACGWVGVLRLQHSTSQYIIINFAHASTLNMPPKKRGRYSGSRELKIFSDIKTLALWFIFGDIKGVAKPRGFREEGFKCPGGARKRHKRRSRNDRAFMTLQNQESEEPAIDDKS